MKHTSASPYSSIRCSRWNPRINLISQGRCQRLWARHVEDSLQLLPLMPHVARGARPRLGRRLAWPWSWPSPAALPFTLVESDARKCAFLREARAEQASAGVVDAAASRRPGLPRAPDHGQGGGAAAPLLALCGPLLAPGGTLLVPKGATVDDESTASPSMDHAHGAAYKPTRAGRDPAHQLRSSVPGSRCAPLPGSSPSPTRRAGWARPPPPSTWPPPCPRRPARAAGGPRPAGQRLDRPGHRRRRRGAGTYAMLSGWPDLGELVQPTVVPGLDVICRRPRPGRRRGGDGAAGPPRVPPADALALASDAPASTTSSSTARPA